MKNLSLKNVSTYYNENKLAIEKRISNVINSLILPVMPELEKIHLIDPWLINSVHNWIILDNKKEANLDDIKSRCYNLWKQHKNVDKEIIINEFKNPYALENLFRFENYDLEQRRIKGILTSEYIETSRAKYKNPAKDNSILFIEVLSNHLHSILNIEKKELDIFNIFNSRLSDCRKFNMLFIRKEAEYSDFSYSVHTFVFGSLRDEPIFKERLKILLEKNQMAA
tara:strand:- start:2120 stop:2794 length:675 start_codon:yes stop_codon:yes gene_type:complete